MDRDVSLPLPLAATIDLCALTFECAMLTRETQAVAAMRLLGMTGFWNTHATETLRMVAEKPAAFGRATEAAMTAALQGHRLDQVAAAAVAPLRRKTHANAARLYRYGPTLPV
ncbi:MAG: antifreeze protein [Pseudomonadota bacterium]